MFWRVSTYSQQTPADAILDKGHVILEDLLEVEDLAKVCLRVFGYPTPQDWAVLTGSCPDEGGCMGWLACLYREPQACSPPYITECIEALQAVSLLLRA